MAVKVSQEEALRRRREASWTEVRAAHARVDSVHGAQIDRVLKGAPKSVRGAAKVASKVVVGAAAAPAYAIAGAEKVIARGRQAAAKKLSSMYPKKGGKP